MEIKREYYLEQIRLRESNGGMIKVVKTNWLLALLASL